MVQKPTLPPEIAALFPDAVVKLIHSFVPWPRRKATDTPTPRPSPALERDLRRIQGQTLRGKSETFMRDLEDFILD
jgi:hypothetical protein